MLAQSHRTIPRAKQGRSQTCPARLRRLLLILIELENDDQRSSGRYVLCHLTSESSEDTAIGSHLVSVSLGSCWRMTYEWASPPTPGDSRSLRAGRLNKSNLDHVTMCLMSSTAFTQWPLKPRRSHCWYSVPGSSSDARRFPFQCWMPRGLCLSRRVVS